MNPALIQAGVGFLGSVFGGRPSTPGYVKRAADQEYAIRQMGIDLYNNTNLADQDAGTIAAYERGAMDRAMKMASNYDAKAAGAGSSIFKGDTAKGRARAQIFGDAGARVSDLEANLSSTRAGRRASLLPTASPGAALAAGQQMDAYNQSRYAAEQQGLLDFAALAASLFGPKGKSGGQEQKRNDRMFGIDFSGGPATALGYKWGQP